MRRTRHDWRRSVLQDPKLADSTRVLLLHIADNYMKSNRKFCVPRKQLAEELNRHERRIAERMADAHKRGYLLTVSPGYIGHTAEYEGTWPSGESVTGRSTHQEGDGFPHTLQATPERKECDGFPHTTSKRHLTAVGVLNVGSDDHSSGPVLSLRLEAA